MSERQDLVDQFLDVQASVLKLFATCRPTDVARFVTEVIFDAFQCQSLRSRADVGEEGLKRAEPFCAHRNTPAAVVSEGRIARISTTPFRRTPALVCTALAACGVALAVPSPMWVFHSQASATFHVSAFQVCACNGFDLTAGALAVPRGAPPLIRCLPEHCQSIESLAGQIKEGWHV